MPKLNWDEPPGYRDELFAALRELASSPGGLRLCIDGQEDVRLETLERDGETLIVLPDALRHERRIQRLVTTGFDRVVWVTLMIACGTANDEPAVDGHALENLHKQFGTLPAARNDLEAAYQYYQPMMVGKTLGLMPGPYSMLSPGYYQHLVKLDNPTKDQFVHGVAELVAWLNAQNDNPEYVSYQFNFFFSGHGELTDNGRAAIRLADGAITAIELGAALFAYLPHEIEYAARLDLYLDCCHSAAVARELIRTLEALQADPEYDRQQFIRPGQIYCACLDDEESFEFPNLQHGVFTFAFLNECSRRRPEGYQAANLGLRDVGWYTDGAQHPLLVNFQVHKGFDVKFPSTYYITNPPAIDQATAGSPLTAPAFVAEDAMGRALELAHYYRSLCAHAESVVRSDSRLRKDFSREELLSNKKFPFL